MDWIGFAALLLSFLLWLFNPGPIRRLFGLEKPPPPAPVYAAGTQEELMRRNPEIDEALTPELIRFTSWISTHLIKTAIANGNQPLTTRRGAEIHFQTNSDVLVLVVVDAENRVTR